MPTERLPMRKIRDVLRLKFEAGLSERPIARPQPLSNGAVNGDLQRARVAGLGWPLPDHLDDTALEQLLFPPAPPVAGPARPVPDWPWVEKELRRRGVILAPLWEEYRTAHPDGFGYSWFCEHYAAFKKRMRPAMRQTRAAGEKVFVDFAGDMIDIVDPVTGEVRPMKLFAAVMGASNYVFVQARPSEKIADWIGAHVDLFAFLGGVPKFAVCDNLKAAVTNPDRYEPGLNRSYLELAGHYGAAILPGRPYKPRDKAKAEQSVLLAERWVLARLRNARFFSAADLSAALGELARDINARPMRGFNASRAELFATLDKPALKSLPDEPCAFAVWKRCRVAPDYHAEADGHWYSAPFRLIRELVDVRAADKTVEIFLKGQRIASHMRAPNRRGHTTLPEHMPSAHRRHASWTPARLIAYGEKVGPSVAALFEAVMTGRPHPEQGFRTCLGILALTRTCDNARVDAARRRGVPIKARSVASIRSILKNGLDRAFLDETEGGDREPVRHGNIRGGHYYH
ncbi:MAG: IS21 family transposase [Methylocella sp.]